MSKHLTFTPPGMEWMESDYGMSPAIRAGDLVWLSGVTVSPDQGQSIEDAFESTFSKITTILGQAGLGWNDVVDITSLHVDIAPQKEPFMKVKSRYITKKPYPAWTAMEVKGLWGAALIAEIKIVASAA